MLQHQEIDLLLIRQWFTSKSSIGELFFPADSKFRECFILEDVARAIEVKLPHITCIPAVDLFIKITMSTRFKRLMPIIYNEEYYKDPNTGREYWDLIRVGKVIFVGVRMHPGNSDVNTDACQLPGLTRIYDRVLDSVDAFDPLYKKIFDKIGTTGKLNYRIINDPI